MGMDQTLPFSNKFTAEYTEKHVMEQGREKNIFPASTECRKRKKI